MSIKKIEKKIKQTNEKIKNLNEEIENNNKEFDEQIIEVESANKKLILNLNTKKKEKISAIRSKKIAKSKKPEDAKKILEEGKKTIAYDIAIMYQNKEVTLEEMTEVLKLV